MKLSLHRQNDSAARTRVRRRRNRPALCKTSKATSLVQPEAMTEDHFNRIWIRIAHGAQVTGQTDTALAALVHRRMQHRNSHLRQSKRETHHFTGWGQGHNPLIPDQHTQRTMYPPPPPPPKTDLTGHFSPHPWPKGYWTSQPPPPARCEGQLLARWDY